MTGASPSAGGEGEVAKKPPELDGLVLWVPRLGPASGASPTLFTLRSGGSAER